MFSFERSAAVSTDGPFEPGFSPAASAAAWRRRLTAFFASVPAAVYALRSSAVSAPPADNTLSPWKLLDTWEVNCPTGPFSFDQANAAISAAVRMPDIDFATPPIPARSPPKIGISRSIDWKRSMSFSTTPWMKPWMAVMAIVAAAAMTVARVLRSVGSVTMAVSVRPTSWSGC